MKKLFVVVLLALSTLALAACNVRVVEQATITLTSDLEEAVLTIAPSATVDVDTEVTVEASEIDGYTFTHWENVETGVEVSTDRVYTFPAVANMTLKAVYLEDTAVEDVDIVLSSDLGEAVLSKTPTGPVAPGTEVTVSASSVSGYVFLHWLDSDAEAVLTENASHTFSLSQNMNLVAVYAQEAVDDVNIAFESNVSGATMTKTPTGAVAPGTEVTISASEESGYVFEHWLDVSTSAVVSENRSHTFVLNQNRTLRAVYLTEAAHEAKLVLEAFDGDLTHLEPLMANFMASDAFTIEFEMVMQIAEAAILSSEAERHEMRFVYRNVEFEDTMMHELEVYAKLPDMDIPGDALELHFIVVEHEDYIEMYADVGVLLDQLSMETGMNLRLMLGFANDYVYVNLPHEMVEDFFGELLVMFEDEMGEIDFDPAMIDVVLAELHRFEKYFTLDYYDAHEDLDLDMEREDSHIHTIMTMNSDLIKALFEDLFEDVYSIAYLVAEEGELPPYEDFIASPDYAEMMLMLGMIEPFAMTMTYEPSTEDWMRLSLDLHEILEPYGDGMDVVEEFYINIDFHSDAEITLPTDAKDVTDLAKEMLQFALMMEVMQFSYRVLHQPDVPEDTYTLSDLDALGYSFNMPFIDREMSTVTVASDKTDFELDFYLSSNNEALFHAPISLDELDDAFDFDEPGDLDREGFLSIIGFIDEENISLYLIALELLAFMREELQDPLVPDGDLYPELIHEIPRYEGAVIVRTYDWTEYGSVEVHYVAETTVSSVFTHYINFFDEDDGWDVMIVDSESSHFGMHVWHEDLEGVSFWVYAYDGSGYQNAISIEVTKTFPPEPDFPDDDQGDLQDIESVPRYPGSVLYYGDDDGDNQYRTYLVADAEPSLVWTDYAHYLETETDWMLEWSYYDEGDDHGTMFFRSETHELWINVFRSHTFPDATKYHVGLMKIEEPEFPDEDQVDLDDIAEVPRYTGSVMVDGWDDDFYDYQDRTYLVDGTHPEDVYIFYFSLFDGSPDWVMVEGGYDEEDEWGYMRFDTDTHTLWIDISDSRSFPGATWYFIELQEIVEPEFPEEDQTDHGDIEAVPRYLESVLVNAWDSYDETRQERTYLIDETDPEDVWTHYIDHFNDDPLWTFNFGNYYSDDDMGYMRFDTDTHTLWIHVYFSDMFPTATRYYVVYEELEGFPEDDQVDLDDIDGIERYMDSVMTGGWDYETGLLQERFYLIDYTDPGDVWDHYFDTLDANPDWTFDDGEYSDDDETGYLWFYSDSLSLYIGVQRSSDFPTATSYFIQINERHEA